jgi:hypothetical protein
LPFALFQTPAKSPKIFLTPPIAILILSNIYKITKKTSLTLPLPFALFQIQSAPLKSPQNTAKKPKVQ